MDKTQKNSQTEINSTIPVENTIPLSPELFFSPLELEIMNSFFNVLELRPKLLEHLENYKKENNIERSLSGNLFYQRNIDIIKDFSQLETDLEPKSPMLIKGGLIISQFYPDFRNLPGKDDVIGVFHLQLHSAFKK